MSKDEVIGILGTFLSGILALIGFLWSIGALQLIFSFLAGSFSTYVVQHRLQIESEKRKIRRENAILMRDNIYGPIFKEISKILEGVELVQNWYLENLKGIMAHYLFFTVKQNLKTKLSELLDRVEKYGKIRWTTELMVQDIMRKEIEKSYQVDIGSDMYAAILRLLIGKPMVSAITLKETLFRDIAPKDFMRTETEKWGEGISVEVTIGGRQKSLSDFESLHEHVLHEIEKESLYIEEKKQRIRLINELEKFLDQIKAFINLE